ncbi:MAG: response regulator [Deltaproteobacteria bacterium]|nr:response regulator [Deltaproteobacteria bacterium]
MRSTLELAGLGTWTYSFETRELDIDECAQTLHYLGTRHLRDDDPVLRARLHLGDMAGLIEQLKTCAPEERAHGEYRVLPPDGGVRWMEAWGRLEISGEGTQRRPVRLVGVSRDVTEQKLAAQALREADQHKNDFLAVLSHELRNPLAPISASLRVLERAEPGGRQALRAQQVIARQVKQLSHLVDDLLDMTRVSCGKMRLQRQLVDLNELVSSVVEDLRSLFAQREVWLRFTPAPKPVLVSADPARLAQIASNLLQNAAKFTGPGGSTCISIWQEQGKRRALLRVADTGVGVAPQLLPHLFQPFMQANRSLEHEQDGLGLGLAVVKGLVELHGGEITACSDGPGKGMELLVRLPLAEPAAVSPSSKSVEDRARASTSNPRRSRRVLVIEDNVDAADSLREALAQDGHEVAIAHDGLRGLETARALRPEIILCDIGLPGMDGYAVARELRDDPDLRDTYLVALSGYAQLEDLQQSAKAGFALHLAKPPDLEALERVLAEAPRPSPR